jgi:hypothetical protein
MQIGAADPATRHVEHQLTIGRLRVGQLDDLQRTGPTAHGFHRTPDM